MFNLLVASVLMVVWLVIARMWLDHDSFGAALTFGLVCAGIYAALVSVGLYRKARRDGAASSEDAAPTN